MRRTPLVGLLVFSVLGFSGCASASRRLDWSSQASDGASETDSSGRPRFSWWPGPKADAAATRVRCPNSPGESGRLTSRRHRDPWGRLAGIEVGMAGPSLPPPQPALERKSDGAARPTTRRRRTPSVSRRAHGHRPRLAGTEPTAMYGRSTLLLKRPLQAATVQRLQRSPVALCRLLYRHPCSFRRRLSHSLTRGRRRSRRYKRRF